MIINIKKLNSIFHTSNLFLPLYKDNKVLAFIKNKLISYYIYNLLIALKYITINYYKRR